jgi:D-tyrosyl-tRNA(Tyr) deacylase
MRVLIQRVSEASVTVDGEIVGQIGKGLLALVASQGGDGAGDVVAAARKLTGLRIFGDASDKMNLSLADVGGSVLVVSQFTLLGDVRRGRRPSFAAAAPPEQARAMIDLLVAEIGAQGIDTATGAFGRRMSVGLVNDGPVTLMLAFEHGRAF